MTIKRNGFTLMELLVVIGMISILMIIFMPSLLGIQGSVKKNTYDNKISLIESAAENLIEDNKNIIKSNANLCVNVEYLIKHGYLTSEGNDGAYMVDPTNSENNLDGKIELQYYEENGVWKAKAVYDGTQSCLLAANTDENSSNKYSTTDNEIPSGNGLLIDDGASETSTLTVKLTISNTSGTATQMCIQNVLINGKSDAATNCSEISWIPYSETYIGWELYDDGNKQKNVYVWLRNSNNKTTTSPVTDTITFIDGPPKITITPANNTSYTKNQSTTIKVESFSLITSVKYNWLTSTTTNALTSSISEANPKSKNYSLTVKNSTNSGTYYLCVTASNKAGYTLTTCSANFYLDNSAPYITIAASNDIKKSHTPLITTGDSYVNLNAVKYAWGTDETQTRQAAVNGTNLTSNSLGKTLSVNAPSTGAITGNRYLCIYAADILGNNNTVCSYFKFDNTLPVVSVNPTSGTSYKNSYSVYISATDINISNPSYRYVLSTSSSGFANSAEYSYTSGSYNTVGTGYNGIYYLYVRQVADVAGNVSSINNILINGVVYHRFGPYYFDNVKPTVTVSPTYNYTYTKAKYVTITGNDDHLLNPSYQFYVSTSTTSINGSLYNYTSGSSSYISGLTGAYYILVKQLTDTAGNKSTGNNTTIGGNVYHYFGPYYFDNTPPSIYSFNINSGATTTTTTSVTLYSNVSGADQMCFSNEYSGGCSSWVSYSSSYSWTISGYSTSTVYAWYRDSAGNQSGPTSDNIRYEPHIYPSGSIWFGSSTTTSTSVYAYFSYSNAQYMCVSPYGACSSWTSLSSGGWYSIAGYENSTNYLYVTYLSSTGDTATYSAGIYYSKPAPAKPSMWTNLTYGYWYPAGTWVDVTCDGNGSNITYFSAHDDSSRFGTHANDYGSEWNYGSQAGTSICMVSASHRKCTGSCTYWINGTCSNAGGTISDAWTFELGLTG